ncbi:hypothetical protein IFR05_005193 [Cadophora sp. M221]|nr:hypothetical protein IFR05_005193 [Cadophora sp. M221]
MDPASILAIVGGVCMVVKGCIETYETWSTYREHKASLALGNDTKRQEEKLSQELESSPSKVQAQYNQLLDSVGGRFTKTGDKTIQQDFKKILGKQQYLIKYLQALRNQSSKFQSSPEVFHSIRVYADGIQVDLTKAMHAFAKRTSSSNSLLGRIFDKEHDQYAELDATRWPRKFCYGALLLQSDDYLDGAALACDPALFVLGFTCKYCSLEVGDYRMRSSKKTAVSTRLLAASHVVSCPSFMDRRAAYKCLPCHAKHFDIDFPSATALERHLKKHPNTKQLRDVEEKDIMEELNIDPEELGLQPDTDDVEKGASLLCPPDSAKLSKSEPSAAYPRTPRKVAPADAVSINSVEGTLKPASTSNAPWDDGGTEFGFYADSIPELESNEHFPPTPLLTPAQAPRRSNSSRRPQTPPQPAHYQAPAVNKTSRNPTPNPQQQAHPGHGYAENAIYQQHSPSQQQQQQQQPQQQQFQQTHQYQQAPPVPNRPPPKQEIYQNSQQTSRASFESDQYNRAMSMGGQKPVPTMPDLSQGYHPKHHLKKQVPEPEDKKEGGFFTRNKNKKKSGN